jgi:tetratricopeptide (TPR) repeat protein
MISNPLILLTALLFPAIAMAQNGCGALTNAYGPFDYRTAKDKLAIVEQYHFTSEVETLRSGATGTVGSDLDYTLRASPNHHRALNAMANLAVKSHTDKPRGARYTVECWFDRAIRFAQNDGVVRIIQGVYLSRIDRPREAVRVFEEAKAYEQGNANLYYNLGLAYCDLKDYPNALTNAHRAYALGAPLPGLRNKLQAAGKWRDPTPDESAAKANAASAAPR